MHIPWIVMDKARKFLGNCLSTHFSLRVYIFLPTRQKKGQFKRKKVLSIRIGFNANLDPAFNLNAGPNPDPGAKPMWIHAEPDPGLTVTSQKFDCLNEKYTLHRL
jgi:hypothetical protein